MRVLIDAQPWAALARRGSNFRFRDDSPARVYDLQVGGASATARTLGLLSYEWIDPGEYRFDLDGQVVDVEVAAPQSEGRLRGLRSLTEPIGPILGAAGDGSDESLAIRAAIATGDHIIVPRGTFGAFGHLACTTVDQTFVGVRGATFHQLDYGKLLFDCTYVDGVTFVDVGFAYPGLKGPRPSWNYTAGDAAKNLLVNQDSTISRSAFIYSTTNRTTVLRCRFGNTYASVRLRAPDRFNGVRTYSCRVLYCEFEHFQFGVIYMNQLNMEIVGNSGRFTDATDTAPPHLLYGAGACPPPFNVTPAALDPDDEPPPYDTTCVGGVIAHNRDYRNLYSSSYKIRGCEGVITADNVSVECARGFETAWCQDMIFDFSAYDGQQIVSATTGEPTDSSTQSLGQVQYSSSCVAAGRMHTKQGEFVSGWTVRSNNYDLTMRCHAASTYRVDTGSRAPFKAVDSGGHFYDQCSWQSVGFDRPAMRFFNSDGSTIYKPRASHGNSTHGKMFDFDATSDGNRIVVDPDRIGVQATTAQMLTSLGANNTLSYVGAPRAGSAVWNPGSVASGSFTSTTLPVTGAQVGDPVAVGFTQAVPAGAALSGAVTAADTVTVSLLNLTGGPVDLASGTLRANVTRT